LLPDYKLQTKIAKIKDLRRKWIAALESGDFEQTQSKLAESDYSAYCCLGVAEEKVGYACGITRVGYGEYKMPNPDYSRFVPEEGHVWEDEEILADSELHLELRNALGLSEKTQGMLISINDAGGSFSMIADVLRNMPVYIDGTYYDD
jgi:hypothetical protein